MKHFISFLSCCLIFISCKKQGPAGPQGQTGTQGGVGQTAPPPRGTISGLVSQFDEFSKKQSSGLNSVTVSISGTTLSTITDEKGVYTFTDISAGTYTLEFKGPKTNVLKNTQVIFVGNGTLYVPASIYDKPTWTFVNLTAQIELMKLKISGSYGNTGSFPRAMLALFSSKPNINPQDLSSYDYVFLGNPNVYIQYNTYGLPQYPEGSVHYVKIYPLVPGGTYEDAASQKTVYYGVGDLSSPVYTITTPIIN